MLAFFVVLLGSLKVMLICGSDLLQSFSIPGVWIREQVNIHIYFYLYAILPF